MEQLIIVENISIKGALKKLDETGKKILLVCDGNNKLEGIITDGDIRRWILKNGDLSESVKLIMSKNPKFLYTDEKHLSTEFLKDNNIEAIPILNKNNQVIDIIFWNDSFEQKYKFENIKCPIVIMAGGKGTRLEPYTKVLPKPLIPIGDTPIVERIINKFNEYGCKEFYMTVNYKKNMIKAYFNEINKNYNIEYIDEDKPLGTAGSLHFLKDKIKETFFVSNCDILIDGNYSEMLKEHKKNNVKITLITSMKNYEIPYGVIEINNNSNVIKMKEKPEYNFLVNTGMYILEPEVLNDIPKNEFFHITDLINLYIEKGESIGVYPVSEGSWMDMGQFKEMEIMLERLDLK